MKFFRLLVAAMAAIAASAPAHSADYLGRAVVVDPGVCGQAQVLNAITHRFRHQVRHVPNLPQVDITGFAEVGLNRYEPAHEQSPIARHYCRAVAQMTDGRSRQVWFLIEEGAGFASIGDNVEFCVAGFDRWLVYNSPWCRVLR